MNVGCPGGVDTPQCGKFAARSYCLAYRFASLRAEFGCKDFAPAQNCSASSRAGTASRCRRASVVGMALAEIVDPNRRKGLLRVKTSDAGIEYDKEKWSNLRDGLAAWPVSLLHFGCREGP